MDIGINDSSSEMKYVGFCKNITADNLEVRYMLIFIQDKIPKGKSVDSPSSEYMVKLDFSPKL